MEVKQVSGIVCYVANLDATEDFYKQLGFQLTKRDEVQISISLGTFWVDCIAASSETKAEFRAEAQSDHKGAGLYLYIEVADVDAFHEAVLEKGIKPSSEPKDWPWGNREFVVRDPDGYKLVFFTKLAKES